MRSPYSGLFLAVDFYVAAMLGSMVHGGAPTPVRPVFSQSSAHGAQAPCRVICFSQRYVRNGERRLEGPLHKPSSHTISS